LCQVKEDEVRQGAYVIGPVASSSSLGTVPVASEKKTRGICPTFRRKKKRPKRQSTLFPVDARLPVPWPPPEPGLPPDEVLERLDQVHVLPMPIGGALVGVPVTSNDTIRKEPQR